MCMCGLGGGGGLEFFRISAWAGTSMMNIMACVHLSVCLVLVVIMVL